MPAEPRELIQKNLGYRFTEATLLLAALTHRSYANEHKGEQNTDNERLEFLGDAVLNLVVSTALYQLQPQLSEGEMTRQRAEVVNATVLARLARSMTLGPALLLGRGEEKSGGRDKDNLLADALEALFGAIYCEAGLAAVQPVILALFAAELRLCASRRSGTDFKTQLQEALQAQRLPVPDYRLAAASGPDHARLFAVAVYSGEVLLGQGQGRSKKEAEQAAAGVALTALEQR